MLSALAAASLADGVFGLSGSLPASMALRNATICEPCVGSGNPPINLMNGMPEARRTDPIPPPGTETCEWGPTEQKSLVSVCSYDGKTGAVNYPNEVGPFQIITVPSDQTTVKIALKIKEQYRSWIEFCPLVLRVLYGEDVTRKTVIGGSSSSEWNTKGVVVTVDPAKGTVKITENKVSGIVRRDDWGDECPLNTFMPNRHGFEVIKNITQKVFELNKELNISLKYGAVAKTLSVTINNYTAVLSEFKNFRMIQLYGLSECWISNISVTQANCDPAKSGNKTSVDSNSSVPTGGVNSSQSCEVRNPVPLFSGCIVRPKNDQSEELVIFNNKDGRGNVSGDLSDPSNFPGEGGGLFANFPDDKDDFKFETRMISDPVIKDVFDDSSLGCGVDLVLMPNAWYLNSDADESFPTTRPLFVVSVDSSTGTATINLETPLLLTYSEHCSMEQRPMIIQEKMKDPAVCSMSVPRGSELRVWHERIGDIFQVGLATNVGPPCSVRLEGMRWAKTFSMKLIPKLNSKALEAPSLCYEHWEFVNITHGPGCGEGISDSNYTVDLTTPDDPIYTTDPKQKKTDNHEEQSAWNDISEFIKENVVFVTIIGSILGVALLSALYFCLLYRQSREDDQGQEMVEVVADPEIQDVRPVQTEGGNNVENGQGASTGHQTPDIQPVVARNQGEQTDQEIADLGELAVVDTPQGPGKTDPTSLNQNPAIEAAGPQGGGNGAIMISSTPVRGQDIRGPNRGAENRAIISSTLEFNDKADEADAAGSYACSQASSGGSNIVFETLSDEEDSSKEDSSSSLAGAAESFARSQASSGGIDGLQIV